MTVDYVLKRLGMFALIIFRCRDPEFRDTSVAAD